MSVAKEINKAGSGFFNQGLQYPWQLLVTAALYYVAAKLGLKLAFAHANVSPVWPPTGVDIALVVLWGYRIWPAIAVSIALINVEVLAGSTPMGWQILLPTILITIGNTLEAIVAVIILRKAVGQRHTLTTLRGVLIFIIAAAIIAPVISATLGVLSLPLDKMLSWALSGPLWLTWYVGDAVGALTTAPLILSLHDMKLYQLRGFKAVEALFLIMLILGLGVIFWGSSFGGATGNFSVAYLFMPLILWAILRFYILGATISVSLVSAISIIGTLRGFGPFTGMSANESLVFLQLFIGIIAVTSLVIAAVLYERKELEAALINSVANQEREIQSQTRNLRTINSLLNLEVNRRQAQQEVINQALHEKELLLREVHHRVKNNMAIIASLLNLHGAALEDGPAVNALRESRTRIKTMAVLHEILYNDENLKAIHLRSYLETLMELLRESYGLDSSNLKVRFNIDESCFDIDRMMPIGLLFNELVTNSLKHAFHNIEKPEINITFSLVDNSYYELAIIDNGKGFVPSEPEKRKGKIGLTLVDAFVKQLDGTMQVSSDSGARYFIRIPSRYIVKSD